MTPRLIQLSKDLAEMLNDRVLTGDVSGKKYTAEQRLLALNRAEGSFISRAVIEQTPNELAKSLQELLRTTSLAMGTGNSPSPSDSIRVVKARAGGLYWIYVKPESWMAVKLGYNPEDTETVALVNQIRWTEFNKTVYWYAEYTAIAEVMYIKDHVEMAYGGTNDFLLPARFDAEILKASYSFLTNILPKESEGS